MPLMKFREPNQVRWFGFRPAHRGTFVTDSGGGNVADVIIYTVSAGKVLHLYGFNFSVIGTAVVHFATLKVRNAADVFQYDIVHLHGGVNTGNSISHDLIYPIEIPAGYDIYASSGWAACTWKTVVWGWEE